MRLIYCIHHVCAVKLKSVHIEDHVNNSSRKKHLRLFGGQTLKPFLQSAGTTALRKASTVQLRVSPGAALPFHRSRACLLLHSQHSDLLSTEVFEYTSYQHTLEDNSNSSCCLSEMIVR